MDTILVSILLLSIFELTWKSLVNILELPKEKAKVFFHHHVYLCVNKSWFITCEMNK